MMISQKKRRRKRNPSYRIYRSVHQLCIDKPDYVYKKQNEKKEKERKNKE
jgi:hypothetical protein